MIRKCYKANGNQYYTGFLTNTRGANASKNEKSFICIPTFQARKTFVAIITSRINLYKKTKLEEQIYMKVH